MFGKIFKINSKTISKCSSLEDDLLNLIFNLENNGVAYLVKQMGNDNIYSNLLLEKRKHEISNTDDISWYAYRQSEKLNSEIDKNELLRLLSKDEFSGYKKYIYCCLSSICSNTNDKELFNFLIDKVTVEENERVIVSILSRLEYVKKDSSFNIEPLKQLVKEGTYDICNAAISALSNSDDPEVETILLDEFKITSKHMKGMICSPLGTVGTIKSIPILKKEFKETRDQSLKSFISRAIYEIEKRENSKG